MAFALTLTVSDTVTNIQVLQMAVCRAYKEPCNKTEKYYLM